MDMLAARSFRVLLAVALAANCCLPCYTFAYADESQGVESVPQEEQEEIAGDAGGLEFTPGVGESNADAADAGAAAEGHGLDDGETEGAIEDIAADYGGLVLTSDLPLYSVRAASAVDVVGQTWGSVKDTVSTTWNLVKDYLQWFYGGDTWLTQVSTVERAKIIPQFTLMNVIKQQWGYNYGTGGTIVWAKNSPAGWLNSLYLDLSSLNSFLRSQIDGGYFTTWIYYIYDNGLKLREQNDRLYDFLHSQYDGRYFTTTLGYIYDAISTFESPLSNFDSKFDKVISALGLLNDSIHTLDMIEGLLATWGDRWDSEYYIVIEWGKAWEAYKDDLFTRLDDLGSLSLPVDVDLSETNKLLGRLTADVASIRDKYVLEDALGSILDVLVGDLQTPQTHAALSSIQDVMATRFPFCIPSLVNAVLFGSILADAAPPVWEFDIAGSPLVVDFSDYGQFAEVCRWTVLLLFTASLLLNTRRFIYGMGGGVE